MPVTPISRDASEVHDLRGMVARSETFQAQTGFPGNPAAALARVHIDSFYPELLAGESFKLHRPFAVVMPAPGPLWSDYAGGDQVYLARSGKMLLYLSDGQRHEDPTDDWTAFANFAGGVIEDLANRSGYSVGDLPISTISRAVEPRRPRVDRAPAQQERERWWFAIYSIDWS